MGRSVNYARNALKVWYFPYESDPDDGDENWTSLIHEIRVTLCSIIPSFEPYSKWTDRELLCILRNNYSEIVISEYCGLCSLSFVMRDDVERPALAEHWMRQVVNGIDCELLKVLNLVRKVGTFSNGESVYMKVGDKEEKT